MERRGPWPHELPKAAIKSMEFAICGREDYVKEVEVLEERQTSDCGVSCNAGAVQNKQAQVKRESPSGEAAFRGVDTPKYTSTAFSLSLIDVLDVAAHKPPVKHCTLQCCCNMTWHSEVRI